MCRYLYRRPLLLHKLAIAQSLRAAMVHLRIVLVALLEPKKQLRISSRSLEKMIRTERGWAIVEYCSIDLQL